MKGKIGVTGASGFIGNNIVKYLSEEGYKVVAFGRESEKNFISPNIEWNLIDLNQVKPEDLDGIEKLIHFAGAYNADDAFSKNVTMLKKVLEASSNSKVKDFYLISTYGVFGNRETPAGVNAPYHPLEAYAMSKVMAEEAFKKFLESAHLRGVIVRPCSLYGRYGRNFIDVIGEKIKKGDEIQMVHFRNQFLYIHDFYLALKEIIEKKNPEASYNVEGEVTTEETLKKIFEDLGVKYSLSEQIARSYWCEGIKAPLGKTVKDYLKEIKGKNAI